MSTHVPGFQSFFLGFLHHFVLAKLATRSIKVNQFKSIPSSRRALVSQKKTMSTSGLSVPCI